MKSRTKAGWALLVSMAFLMTLLVGTATAHDSPNDGHIPKDANYGFEVVGRDTLAGVVDGNYTDVWSHDGFAYIGTFQSPCSGAGVFIVDMGSGYRQRPLCATDLAESAPRATIWPWHLPSPRAGIPTSRLAV